MGTKIIGEVLPYGFHIPVEGSALRCSASISDIVLVDELMSEDPSLEEDEFELDDDGFGGEPFAELPSTPTPYGTVMAWEEAELAGMHVDRGRSYHPPTGDYYNPPENHARHSPSVVASLMRSGHDLESF